MATITTKVLTLFDPDNKFEWCDTRFNKEIFIRFSNPQYCRQHIGIHVTHPTMDVHFFFPDAQIEHIRQWRSEHNNTLKYIFCNDQTSINAFKERHGRHVAHKLFTINDLEFEINHVEIALLYSLAKQAPEDSQQRNKLATTAIEQLECLGHKLKQMMIEQTSEEPVERY